MPQNPLITLIIAGLSPVAIHCIEIAQMLKIPTIVVDHREEIIMDFQQNQPHIADFVTLERSIPAHYIAFNSLTKESAIVALTHDPLIDDPSMISALATPAFYLGVMGSKINSEAMFSRLRSQTSFDEAALSRIHAPIGLPIGSQATPEIALSIMAQIVAHKNGLIHDRSTPL